MIIRRMQAHLAAFHSPESHSCLEIPEVFRAQIFVGEFSDIWNVDRGCCRTFRVREQGHGDMKLNEGSLRVKN